MFQTDPILWLQSFSHPFLTFIMQVFTYAGYPTFFIIFILSFFYGVDHKKGWELFHLVLLGGFVTVLAKEFFSYPRPFYLTPSVKLWDPFLLKDFPLVKSYESISFFSLIPENILNEFRKIPQAEFGFPSGHTSVGLCFWGYLWKNYKQNKTISTFCLIMIIFVPFSRLYLGVHFIGDILGGHLLGLFILMAFTKISKYIFYFRPSFSLIPLSYLFLFPILGIFLLSSKNLFICCYLLGMNLVLLFLDNFDFLKKLQERKVIERLVVIFSVSVFFFAIRLILKKGLLLVGLEDNIFAFCFRHTLTAFLGTLVPLLFLKKRFKTY